MLESWFKLRKCSKRTLMAMLCVALACIRQVSLVNQTLKPVAANCLLSTDLVRA